MKRTISIFMTLVLCVAVFAALGVSASAASDVEYIRNGIHTGIWYSNPATKEALDKCTFINDRVILGDVITNGDHPKSGGLTIDIYDDLLLTKSYTFELGTIRCNNCRAFYLDGDYVRLQLRGVTIENGNANCENDDGEMGYGGAIYMDGAHCSVIDLPETTFEKYFNDEGVKAREKAGVDDTIKDTSTLDSNSIPTGNGSMLFVNTATHSYIENCQARYGGAIAVCGHDCTIGGLIFKSNTGLNNGGNDLYVYWGDCKVKQCTFDKDREGAAAHITADTYFEGCNITKKMCVGDVHQVFISNPVYERVSIRNGDYKIYSALDDKMCVDIDGSKGAMDSGDNVHLWSADTAEYNVFTVTNDSKNDGYIIKAKHSGMALDVAGASKANGANITQCTGNDSPAQRWVFETAEDGYCYIRCLGGQYMDAEGCANGKLPADDTNVCSNGFTGEASQMFKLVEAPNSSGSTLSEGNLWIVIGIAVLAVGGVAALVIVRKKKKEKLS